MWVLREEEWCAGIEEELVARLVGCEGVSFVPLLEILVFGVFGLEEHEIVAKKSGTRQ